MSYTPEELQEIEAVPGPPVGDCDRAVELLELSLADFVEAPKDVKPKNCMPGFEPEIILLANSHIAHVQVKKLCTWLKKEYRNGRKIYDGWIDVAVSKAESEKDCGGDRQCSNTQ